MPLLILLVIILSHRLQDDRVMSQKISGAQTERLDRRRKKLDEDRQATKTPHSSHGHRPSLESHKFTRDTYTGKLERSLDGQYVQASCVCIPELSNGTFHVPFVLVY